MEAQAYKFKDNVVFQDDKSTIIMEINERSSWIGNLRHIDIIYFWIKDRVDHGDVRVEYKTTHLMLADYFKKPLMGSFFIKLQKYVYGLDIYWWFNNSIGY